MTPRAEGAVRPHGLRVGATGTHITHAFLVMHEAVRPVMPQRPGDGGGPDEPLMPRVAVEATGYQMSPVGVDFGQ